MSLLPKRPVFAVDVGISKQWWIQPFLPFVRTMALDPLKPMALRTIINAVRDGNMLVIFPEGRITITGSLMKIYDGAAMIADKSDAMVVPVRIDGPEKTMFSRLKNTQVRRRLFPKITVTILEPVKLNVDPELKGRKRRLAAGAALYDVMSNLMFRTTSTDRTVVEAVIEAAQIHGGKWPAIEDPTSGQLTYKRLAAGDADPRRQADAVRAGRASGRRDVADLERRRRHRAGADVGRPRPGHDQLHLGCRQRPWRLPRGASRYHSHRARFRREGATGEADRGDRKAGAHRLSGRHPQDRELRRQAARCPAVRRSRWLPRKPDDWAVILFTSGTEGTPKGVVLSHRNVLSNVAQAEARIDFGRDDRLFMALPSFHSFGFMGGIVLPLISGVPTYLYPSPLHYRTVPELVYGICATYMFGTDTFLAGYARMANSYDFRSLRYIIAGAEPIKEATRRIYLEKFGLRILEGYGVTETSPVLALNTPMFNKFGTVGRLFPGMQARLEKVEGVDEGAAGSSSKARTSCSAILRADKPGVLEPPPDGWYDTGDIVTIDEQGYIAIKGRAKRFAKSRRRDDLARRRRDARRPSCGRTTFSAVAAVPDARKGERLILVTDKHGATRADFQAFARSKHASELMSPAQVIVLDKLPLLGSGKPDLQALQKLVRGYTGGQGRRGGVNLAFASAGGAWTRILTHVTLKAWRAEVSREESCNRSPILSAS